MKLHHLLLLVGLFVGFGVSTGCQRSTTRHVLYHCPMHSNYTSDRPGDCPICNMRLVPVESPADTSGRGHSDHPSGGMPDHPAVVIQPEAAARAGITMALVRRGRLARTGTGLGIVTVDEAGRRSIQARAGGWVRFLHVIATGRMVDIGDPLVVIESPDLLAAQNDYASTRASLASLSATTDPAIRDNLESIQDSARRRLDLLGFPREMMDDLARSGTPQPLVPILSPIRGTVVEKNVVEGMRVEPGMTLFAIADLSRVWVEARLSEEDAARLHVDDRVTLSLPADPSWNGGARVAQVVPQVDPDTRTRLVRIGVDNAGGRLVPGAWVDVRFDVAAAEGLLVPIDAILETGTRRLVYVKEPGNHYAAREVGVGLRGVDEALITTGLAEGDSVVATAAFLVDSETRLRGSHAHP